MHKPLALKEQEMVITALSTEGINMSDHFAKGVQVLYSYGLEIDSSLKIREIKARRFL